MPVTTEPIRINGIDHYPCEVCGSLTPNWIQDVIEKEPRIKEGTGAPFFVLASGGIHYLCDAHAREPKTTEYFKTALERCLWLSQQPKFMSMISEAQKQKLLKFIADAGRDPASLETEQAKG